MAKVFSAGHVGKGQITAMGVCLLHLLTRQYHGEPLQFLPLTVPDRFSNGRPST